MKVKAYKSYTARKANELSLAVDDIIEVEDKTSIDLWKGKLENGNSGLFPTNCVLPLDGDTTPLADKSDSDKKMPFKQLKQIGAKKDSPIPTAASSRQPPLESTLSSSAEVAPKLPPKPVREQVRVIYGYKAQNEDELTIKEGDIITVIAKDSEDAGWWKGELNGRIALFPDNFVEVVQPSPQQPMSRPVENADKLRVKKPDRSATTTAATVSRANSGSSPSSLTADSAPPTTNNALSSVPLIGKMLKFTQSNSNTSSQSSPHKSSDSVPQSLSVSNTNGVASKASEPSDSSPTDDDKDKEDPFNAEPLSPSKLVHLTAQRPKIPSNSRRPPSLIIGKGSEFSDFMDNQEEVPESPPVTAVRQSTDTNKAMPPTVGISLKPVHRPEPESSSSPEKKAPWLSELKKSQERRRTNELMNDRPKPLNGPAAPTPSVKPHAPTPPSAKPFVSNNTKPSLVPAQTVPTVSTNAIHSPASESPPIIAETTSTGANKPAPPVASNSESSQPVTVSSVTSHSTATPSDANNANVLAQAEEMSKMRNEMNELSGTVAELRITVADLRKELAQQSASHKSQTEWTQQKADLEKQLQEQQVFFEGHKKNLTDMVKELINELSEEKKKIAGLQIELDRMRKLTTTV